jgi:hypothetical protein
MIRKESVKITAGACDTHLSMTLPDQLATSGPAGSFWGTAFAMLYSIRPP